MNMKLLLLVSSFTCPFLISNALARAFTILAVVIGLRRKSTASRSKACLATSFVLLVIIILGLPYFKSYRKPTPFCPATGISRNKISTG